MEGSKAGEDLEAVEGCKQHVLQLPTSSNQCRHCLGFVAIAIVSAHDRAAQESGDGSIGSAVREGQKDSNPYVLRWQRALLRQLGKAKGSIFMRCRRWVALVIEQGGCGSLYGKAEHGLELSLPWWRWGASRRRRTAGRHRHFSP